VTAKEHLVVWGLRRRYDSYRYIQAGFAEAGARLGWHVDWVEDLVRNQWVVKPGSLVVSANICQRFLPEVPRVRYVIHNNERTDLESIISGGKGLNLQVWTFQCAGVPIHGHTCFRFNIESRTLFQPWGTPIPKACWERPSISSKNFVFWVGSVWNNALGQGNLDVIRDLSAALKLRGLTFFHPWPRLVSQSLHRKLIIASRLRPAVCGSWQSENGYIPCRAFKNLSFGGLPITNNQAVRVALGDSVSIATDMGSLVDDYLAMSPKEVLDRTAVAQERLVDFTYEANLLRFQELIAS